MGSWAQNSSGVHWCTPGQVQRGSGEGSEGSGEGLEGFGAGPSQVQQDSGEGSGEGSREPWCKAKSGSTGFRRRNLWCVPEKVRRRFREPLMQSQVRFNRDLVQSQVRFNRVREKVPGSLGAKPSQVQRVPEKVAEKVPEKVLGIFGAWPGQVQKGSGEGPGEGFGNLWCRARSGSTASTGFPALASQHASERFVKIKSCGCWGYHRSLF